MSDKDQRGSAENPLLAYGQWLASKDGAWPADARETARIAFIDTLGVTVPGAHHPATQAVLDSVSAWGEGPCTLIGLDKSMAAPWAALVNGTAAHALDFDDNFDPAKAHASAVLVPCILALCEQEGRPAPAAIDAFIAGLQIMGRVGQGLNPAHRNRGWHATATVGALGAAAAAARLLQLDATQAARALSIATSMAGGFMSQFGSQTKPLHAGLAAQAGVMAASFARSGLTAGMQTLQGPTGMQTLMVGPDLDVLRDGLTHVEHGQTLRFETADVGGPLLILSSGLKVKGYPICGSAHRAIDGLIDLMAAHNFDGKDVEAIDVHAPATHLANLMYDRPQDETQAKFSMEYGLAVTALHGGCALGDFAAGALHRPGISEMMARVHRHAVDLPESAFPTRVEVALKDGRHVQTDIAMPRGSLSAPFSIAQHCDKFTACLNGLIPEARIAQAQAMVEGFEELGSVTPLLASLRVAGQG